MDMAAPMPIRELESRHVGNSVLVAGVSDDAGAKASMRSERRVVGRFAIRRQALARVRGGLSLPQRSGFESVPREPSFHRRPGGLEEGSGWLVRFVGRLLSRPSPASGLAPATVPFSNPPGGMVRGSLDPHCLAFLVLDTHYACRAIW